MHEPEPSANSMIGFMTCAGATQRRLKKNAYKELSFAMRTYTATR